MRALLAAMLVGGGFVVGVDTAWARICVQDERSGRIICGQRVHPDFAPGPSGEAPQARAPQYEARPPQAAPQFDEEEEDGAFEAEPQVPMREYGAAPGFGRYPPPPPPPYGPAWRRYDRGYAGMREWYPIGPGGSCPPNYTIQHNRCEPYRGR